ncbi:hypothetical protein E2C01_034977 [Portunus trituberculatus]|uniref:Uncharacterized protein n=1 Tax=Portunus trituberculatus TaxID=210409 RepID=A0A5B7F774_PORTR|nr:hypothetical protein [Portunus trituberculatus]
MTGGKPKPATTSPHHQVVTFTFLQHSIHILTIHTKLAHSVLKIRKYAMKNAKDSHITPMDESEFCKNLQNFFFN